MSEDYSSVDRLEADVGPEYFSVRHLETTERPLSGTTVYLSRAERSRWRDKVTSVVTDAEKREHICPLEEYVRRSTGEIVEKSHGLSQQG
jgi:hypothetical protein